MRQSPINLHPQISMKKPSIIQIASVICSLSLFATAIHAEDKPIKKGLKLAFVPKNIYNPYNVIETGGSIAACMEMGAEGKVVGPSDPSASSQVSYINTLITQRQNAIVLAANDPNALAIAQTPVCRSWWNHMSDLMKVNPDKSPWALGLREMFHID